MGCIYRITKIVNGKKYIGKSIAYNDRINYHCRDCNKVTHIDAAISLYGKDAFKFEIIEDNIPDDKLNEREIFHIKNENTFLDDFHYNHTPGGDGWVNMPQEIRDKISNTKTGVSVHTDESIKAISDYNKYEKDYSYMQVRTILFMVDQSCT